MKSHDQLARLLGLVPYLLARPGVKVTEAATAFGITPRQLINDLNTLWMCGLPGGLPDDLIEIDMEAVTGDGVIHLANVDYLSRPMRLRPDEARALVVAVESLTSVAPGHARPAVQSVLDKLTDLLGAADTGVEIEVSAGEIGLRDNLVAAVETGNRIRLVYHGAQRSSSPIVDPVRLDVVDGYAYLLAWSVDAEDWRSYRVDRIVSFTATGEPTTDHPNPPPPGYWFDSATDRVSVRLRPRVQWVAEYLQLLAREHDGEDIIVTFPVLSMDWVVSLLLRLGPDAAVVSPDLVSHQVQTQARLALSRYR